MELNMLCEPEAPTWLGFGEAANEPSDDTHRRRALREYLVANYARLKLRLLRHLRCSDLASECLHDVWLRLESQAVPESIQKPEAYIYRMACNIAVDRMRSDRSWEYAGDADAELENLADHAPGPDATAAARADLEAFESALGRLPRRHRTVLVALRIDDISRQEVAARYGISLRTVDTALRQALDYCAAHSGQQVFTGVSDSRRALRPLPAEG